MPISSANRKAGPYAGTGTLVALPFSFKVFSDTDLRVVRADSLGAEITLALGVDYTVSINSNQDTAPGGAVTLITPLATGYTAIITSEMANLQPTDLTNQGGFYPKVITNALDRLTIFIQQLAEQVDRAVKTTITDGAHALELPSTSSRSRMALGFDINGDPIAIPANSVTYAENLAASEAAKAAAEAAKAAAEAAKTISEAAKAAAEDAKATAESARDSAIIQSGTYPTEASGRAAVSDGEAFKVQGYGDVAAYEYRRIDALTSTLIATYPSGASVADARQLVFEQNKVTQGVTVLPEVTIGLRSVQPTEVSFDLRVTRGDWADTGLPWAADGRYSGLAILPQIIDIDGRSVDVSQWSFDLRPQAGVYLDTGELWPISASTGQATYPEMVVTTTASEVNIYRKAGAADQPTYTQWHMIYQDVPSRNCRVWRTDRVFEAMYSGNGVFVTGRKIIQTSEVETAVNIAGAYDFAGGYIHGNEELSGPAIWLVDGAQIDPADSVTAFCRKVELIQPTELFLPGSTSETVFAPKGAAFAGIVKQATWTRDVYNLKTHLTEITAGLAIRYAFFGMLPIQRIDDTDGTTQITHTAIRNPLWVAEDVSTVDFGTIETTANEVRIWGDRYGASLRVLAGWTDSSRLTYVDDRAAYNKVYASFYRNDTHTTTAGAALDAEVEITLNIMESV